MTNFKLELNWYLLEAVLVMGLSLILSYILNVNVWKFVGIFLAAELLLYIYTVSSFFMKAWRFILHLKEGDTCVLYNYNTHKFEKVMVNAVSNLDNSVIVTNLFTKAIITIDKFQLLPLEIIQEKLIEKEG